jgi:hypothetical protein
MPGRTALWTSTVPTLANSGHCASSSVPNLASASRQAVLPSAAFGLIVKPGGSVIVLSLISDGEGTVGLCVCGTVRSMSSPDGVSASFVVGVAASEGLNASWLHPVVAGQGASAWVLPLS